jgi:hypothetical protein
MLLFVNIDNIILLKPYEFFIASLYAWNMVPCQFGEYVEQFYILLLFYNKVTCRSSSFPYMSIEVFVNLLDVA